LSSVSLMDFIPIVGIHPSSLFASTGSLEGAEANPMYVIWAFALISLQGLTFTDRSLAVMYPSKYPCSMPYCGVPMKGITYPSTAVVVLLPVPPFAMNTVAAEIAMRIRGLDR